MSFGTMSFALHKYYVSITQVNYSDKDKSIQITCRLFIDDIESTLNTRYGIESKLATKNELKNIDSYVEKYLRNNVKIHINGKETAYNFIGKEYDTDVMKCYLEIPFPEKKNLQTLEISNTLMFDMYPDQQNIIHFKIGDIKKSFVLLKGDSKAVLKL